MNARHLIRGPFLLAIALGTFLPFIGLRDIVISHEARVVQVARQMAESGWPWNAQHIDVPQTELVDLPEGKRLRSRADGATMNVNPWIIPILNGEVRLQKPPLPYWCSATLFRLFGNGEGMSRLVPAILGALGVLFMWDLARMLIGRVGAWYAGLIWFSSYFIVDEFRKSMADPYLAFCTLAAIWAWARSAKSGGKPIWLMFFYAAIGISVLAKGPIIFVFVPVAVLGYRIYYGRRRGNRPLKSALIAHAVGVLIFVLIAAPWFIIVWKSVPNALELWRYESIGELSDNVEKARGWWFYLPNLLQISLPWTPIWLMGLILPFKHPSRRRFFGVACTFVIVLIFSISNVKKNAYLLPLMPIQTLVIAQGWLWLTAMLRVYKRNRPVSVPMLRTTVAALMFAMFIQILISVVLREQDNNRSPKDAARFVTRLMEESPNRSLLVSELAEEASVYLPLGLRDSKNSSEVLLIADDRRAGQADIVANRIATTPAGNVVTREELPIPNAKGPRWKVFKLTIAPSSDPGQPRSDIPAPATSSSESPAGRGSS
ncbi:MAG TPA: glycosyltransferase family 39 protein [Tepidisphaeraceae bacterium]|nr:glycosyltransferase family 39 protein [Tepidisphaeraceae bacterium]